MDRQKRRSIRANKFIVEDAQGRTRVRLAVIKDGPGISLYDENGKTRIKLCATKMGPALSMHDENSEPRIILLVTKDSQNLFMDNENGKTRASLNVTRDGTTILILCADNGNPGALLGVYKYNETDLSLLDEKGKVIWQAP